jgi:6-pyruvoyltetrahydropterin/6-carboxytetrahydropterin synthase
MAERFRDRFLIGKSFRFEAAHQLPGLGADHKCSRLHGHSYHVEVVLASDELAEPGFVTDFGDLAPFGRFLADTLDHRLLNEVLPCEPTSELLAWYLADWFATNVEPMIPGRLVAVRVSETPSSWATFEVEGAGGARR